MCVLLKCALQFAFQDSEKVYFVLQYIEGGELMYHVHSQGRPLELARVVFYAAELVLALEYLHSRNVIYRDLSESGMCCVLLLLIPPPFLFRQK